MQRWQSRSNIQNIILIFSDESSTSKVYLFRADKDCAGEYVQRTYPTASHIFFLPDSFLSVIGMLHKTNIQFSKFDGLLLAHLAVKGDKSLTENTAEFPMEETVNIYCIDRITRHYIMIIAMAPFNLNKRESLVLAFKHFKYWLCLRLKGCSSFVVNAT